MTSATAVDVFADALQIHLIARLSIIASHIERELLRIPAQVLALQVILIGKQQIVHRPEPTLRGGTLRGLGGMQCVRVQRLERKMSIDEPHLLGEALEQKLYRRRGLLAVGAFEIPVLEECHRRMLGAEGVIDATHGDREIDMRRAEHHLSTIRALSREPAPPEREAHIWRGADEQLTDFTRIVRYFALWALPSILLSMRGPFLYANEMAGTEIASGRALRA
jgi:hypothetical protein